MINLIDTDADAELESLHDDIGVLQLAIGALAEESSARESLDSFCETLLLKIEHIQDRLATRGGAL